MAKKNKITMPRSGAGITRYFEDSRSKVEFKPGHVVFFAVVVIVIVIMLHIWGPILF